MSLRTEQAVIFMVMSVLVALFACIYLRNREKRVQLWMIGWIAVFLHFTAQLLGSFSLLDGNWLYFLRVAPLQAAGVSFVLSTSGVYASASRRLLYILLVGMPSVLCTALVHASPNHPWIFPIFVIAHHVSSAHDQSPFWDLHKYFVAIGMIVTLLENETALATRVAKSYQILFEANLTGVYVSTLTGQLLDCNPAFVKMYGYQSKAETLADPAFSFYIQPENRKV